MSDSLPSASPRAWYTGGAQRKKGLGMSACQASLFGGVASITLGMPALFWDQELAQPPRYSLRISECECERVCVCTRTQACVPLPLPGLKAALSHQTGGCPFPESSWSLWVMPSHPH